MHVTKLEDMLAQCHVVTVNCQLHECTKGLINKETLKHIKEGSWIVNTAQGAICDQAVNKEALESRHINGEFPVICLLIIVSSMTKLNHILKHEELIDSDISVASSLVHVQQPGAICYVHLK